MTGIARNIFAFYGDVTSDRDGTIHKPLTAEEAIELARPCMEELVDGLINEDLKLVKHASYIVNR